MAEPGAAPQSDASGQDDKDKQLEEMKKKLAEQEAKIKAMEKKLADKEANDQPNDDNNDTSGGNTKSGDEEDSKSPPKTDVTLSLRGIPEYDQYPFSLEADKFYYMASVKAPYFRSEQRASIDLVAVVDESGSMGGERIKLVKETVKFIIKNLESGDRFGIVGYSSGSRIVLPLTKMNDGGRKQATELADKLRASGGTALCAGLVMGVNMMRNRTGSMNDVASVMLFTDGQANEGPTSAAEINAHVRSGKDPSSGISYGGYGGYRFQPQIQQQGFNNMYMNRNVNYGPPPVPPPMPTASKKRAKKKMNKKPQQSIPSQLQGVPPPNPMLQQQMAPQQMQGYGQTMQQMQGGPPPMMQQQMVAPQIQGQGQGQVTKPKDMIADEDEKEGQKDKKKELTVDPELPCTINTFGFGSGHNESLLESIAENGRGMYAFIEGTKMIADTFAECLGGLVSTIGQDLKIKVEALNNVEINKCLSVGYALRVVKPRKMHEISIKDLQSEENRELIFELKIPKIGAKKENDPIVQLSVSYTNVVKDAKETLSNICSINRIEGQQTGERNMELDVQYNRVLAANAMEEADQLANKGKLEEARKILTSAQDHIKKSRSNQNTFSKNLVNDIETVSNNMRSRQQYQRQGGKMLKMNKKAHMMQRSVQSSCYASQQSYQNRSKSSMKHKFSSYK